ncbi:MAG: hypothetical protein LRS43_00930 [Desulfurococcales archaeon]|nr:hypothetical protein [Desulfurococcales archaeon]
MWCSTLSPDYTSIRVRRDTKRLLEKTLIEFEAMLGRRLDYDELLRLLVERARVKPWLLRRLLESPVEEHDTRRAQEMLRAERRRDTRF